ncbi:MAG: cold-shock protein [Acidobacteriota bacterium]
MRSNGTVKWFSNAKGYGFIAQSTGQDVFVHHKEIDVDRAGFKSLQKGQLVEFDLEDGPKGPMARNVVLLSSAEPAAEET